MRSIQSQSSNTRRNPSRRQKIWDVAHNATSGFSRRNSNCAPSFLGNHSTSESKNARNSPVANCIAALRVAAAPEFTARAATLASGKIRRTASIVPSVEASSPRTISKFSNPCCRIESNALPMQWARLKAGMMILSRGMVKKSDGL
jgi:hypothetical protein